jgi:hypothetical protein
VSDIFKGYSPEEEKKLLKAGNLYAKIQYDFLQCWRRLLGNNLDEMLISPAATSKYISNSDPK